MLRLRPESPPRLRPGWGLRGWDQECGDGGGDGDGDACFSSGSLSAQSAGGGRGSRAGSPVRRTYIIRNADKS